MTKRILDVFLNVLLPFQRAYENHVEYTVQHLDLKEEKIYSSFFYYIAEQRKREKSGRVEGFAGGGIVIKKKQLVDFL